MLRNLGLQELELQILRLVAQSSPGVVNKYNLLGKPPLKGELELVLGRTFDELERNHAYKAFQRLKDSDLLRPTYSDLVDPENWVIITDSGRQALDKGVLDDLDAALAKVDAHLVELRRGAWAALTSGSPHSLAQAAHSARELVDQLLKTGAPDEEVKAQPSFKPDPKAFSGVTRRMRLKLIMTKYRGELSETELEVAEAGAQLVLAIDKKLTAEAHSRSGNQYEEVRAAITAGEASLRSILIPPTRP